MTVAAMRTEDQVRGFEVRTHADGNGLLSNV
jgi:hypothetical protein